MRRLLEAMDSMSKAEKKSTGPKFPGYWKGTDPASKARSRMVGGAEESVIKDLHKTAKDKITEWELTEALKQFKDQEVDYDDEFDAMVSRVGKLAKEGPRKTVWDPVKRVYKTVPVNPPKEKEIKEYENEQSPNAQVTSPPDPDASASSQFTARGNEIRNNTLEAEDDSEAPLSTSAMSTSKPEQPRSFAGDVKKTEPVEPAVTKSFAGDIKKTEPVEPAAPTITPAPPAAIQPTKTEPTQVPLSQRDLMTQVQQVAKASGIKNPDLIYAGDVIKLPSGKDYTVVPGDTLSGILMGRGGQGTGYAKAPTTGLRPGQNVNIDSQTRARAIASVPVDSSLMARIGRAESGDNHNITFGDRVGKDGKIVNTQGFLSPEQFSGKKLSDMSIEEVQAFQAARSKQSPGSSAVGAYGFMPATLRTYANKLGLKPTDKFDASTQKMLQNALMADNKAALERSGIDPTAANQYMAHYIGAGGASAVHAAKGDPTKTVADALVDQQLKRNPNLDRNSAYQSLTRHNPELGRIKAQDFEKVLARRVGDTGTQLAMREFKDSFVDQFKQFMEDYGAATDASRQATNAYAQRTAPGAGPGQDPNQQATAAPTQKDPQKKDELLDKSVARGAMAGLKNYLGPQVDTDDIASAATKMSSGQPTTGKESAAFQSLMPLVAKAAEDPTAATSLKTALNKAGMSIKLGKQ